jgi:hypothetical protein
VQGAWDWIAQNRTWLFSGIGVTAFGVVYWLFKRITRGGRPSGPPSPQLNINVSPNISPTISNAQSHGPLPETSSASARWQPDIRAVQCKASFARLLGDTERSCFIVSFRNDGWADATNVIANVGYIGSSGQKLLVDYGGWIEHEKTIDILRGHTKNLIIAVTDTGKNYAVTDLGPPTNYVQAKLEEAGELTPGDWKMIVTLSADNFRRDYVFEVTIGRDASLMWTPEGTHETKPVPKRPEEPKPNIGSLRPEVTTITYDVESDVWSKDKAGNVIRAALLPFTNEPRPPLKTASLGGLRARLTYYRNEQVEEFKRIDSGCWLDQAYRSVDLHVGDIAYLIAAVRNNDADYIGIVENPRYSSSRYSDDHTDIEELPAGIYEVRVSLFGGEHGEYTENYWYRLECGKDLQVGRINQRPSTASNT